MADERRFRSLQEAARFMEAEIDRPVTPQVTDLGNSLVLRTRSLALTGGQFTNVYDLSWASSSSTAALRFTPRPTAAVDAAQHAPATSSAAFFTLLDEASGLPAQTSLNLAIEQGRVLSMPVVDREALVSRAGALSLCDLTAAGHVALNGTQLTWTGSLTDRQAECYVFGNGNMVIDRRNDPEKGSVRVLDEASRVTPALPPRADRVDVGFTLTGGREFRSTGVAVDGGLDIFAHDLVLRCPARHVDLRGDNLLEIRSVGELHADAWPDSAVTVGPSLDVADFAAHPINTDRSLDVAPPFAPSRRARMVVFEDRVGRAHLRLFDGRPGSRVFQGVTPQEARDSVAADPGFRWGCFIDGGQTAKMWVALDGELTSFGNRHYLRWPKADENEFVWVPDTGRPISSIITLQHRSETQRAVDAARAASLALPPRPPAARTDPDLSSAHPSAAGPPHRGRDRDAGRGR
ncbi:hypothetical protein ABZ541_13805 [Micromonospora sediminicola]|uniref:hypothetical protein n=1 Tax=Micromonospora sediminicola TaxID=946078 RepID=UPI0033DBC9AD